VASSAWIRASVVKDGLLQGIGWAN
jgi:hypothetical protein